jgi:hydrogenase nickel incorporation protein HypB
MCDSCGCGHPHDHPTPMAPAMAHAHGHAPPIRPRPLAESVRTIVVAKPALALNQRHADQNRGWFRAKESEGLQPALLPRLRQDRPARTHPARTPRAAAIVGDLQTDNDAVRLRASGAQALQITTGATCHLDAHMVMHALEKLDAAALRYLFIENVGNLVCPASYDLGEDRRVVLLSVTEGEDKPLKYPVIFLHADLVLVTKIDLADAVGFDRETALAHIRQTAPKAQMLEVSSKTGAGLDAWYAWLAG